MTALLAFLEFGFIGLFIALILFQFINFFFGGASKSTARCSGPHQWKYTESGTDLVCQVRKNTFSGLMSEGDKPTN